MAEWILFPILCELDAKDTQCMRTMTHARTRTHDFSEPVT